MEKLESRIQIGIIAGLGGFATGLATCAIFSALRRGKKDEAPESDWKFGDMLFIDENESNKKEPPTFSDITALVGSVSDSHVRQFIAILFPT